MDAMLQDASSDVCTDMELHSLMRTRILGGASVALGDLKVGFGYVAPDGIPTIDAYALEDGTVTSSRWSANSVNFAVFGSGYITTSLAYGTGRFGFGWYTERQEGESPAIWTTRFASIDEATGGTTSMMVGNAGRGRSGEAVEAEYPHVDPSLDGFVMMWADTRTRDPRVTGSNLVNKHGIYARFYDSPPALPGSEVQITQGARSSSFVTVFDETRTMALWLGRLDGTGYLYARSASTFTRARTPPEIATFGASGRSISAARGRDGHVLAIVRFRNSGLGIDSVGQQLLTMDGTALGPFVVWPDRDLFLPTAISSGDEYIVVAASSSTKTLAIFRIDASGTMIRQWFTSTSIIDSMSIRAIALRDYGAKLGIAVLTANGPTEDTTERYASVFYGTQCLR